MTEAGLFGRAGIPTVICGPGDIAQAHKPDEFIEAAELGRCETFLLRLVESAHA
jgi:acetylornithine deacetylase